MEEIVAVIFEFFGELILQLVVEGLAELGFYTFRKDGKKLHPALAVIGYILLGAAFGLCSLWLFPHHFVHQPLLRLASLIATPIIAGAMAVGLGHLRAKKDQPQVRLDQFRYAYLFALSFALVRFVWAK